MFAVCYFLIILLLQTVLLICTSEALQLDIGDCPIHYDEPCQANTIKFLLSTKTDSNYSTIVLNPFKPKLPRHFNILTPTKVLIHGYGGLTIDRAIKRVSQAYQSLGYNVILVDWEALALVPCYLAAYLNTWHVGQCLAILLVSLIPLGLSPSFVHVVGFSLGAHIAGFAGDHLRKTVGVALHRITGLDPALPFFATLKPDWKLTSRHATFVDIVHTSAGSFGKIEATGHCDFYMNGGSLQPACSSTSNPPLCSHIIAGEYFAESITGNDKNNNSFVGRYCDNIADYVLDFCSSRKKAVMGEYVSYKTRGTYFVDTAIKAPFALGNKRKKRQFLWNLWFL